MVIVKCYNKYMGITKKGWEKRRANMKGTGWNKGQKGLCSIETIQKMSSAKFGKPSWNKGKKLTEEHINKLSLAKIGKVGNRIGSHPSIETRVKNGNNHRGEKCHFWKGGISKLSNVIRTCFQYRQWRSDVFTRDNFTCQECGIKSGCGHTVYFEAHHIKSQSEILEEYKIKTIEEAFNCQELWNINNGITLCLECHKLTDTYAGRNRKKSLNTNV